MYHLHYTGWPDHGVPASAASVLDFIKDILRIETETGNGLTLVHCRYLPWCNFLLQSTVFSFGILIDPIFTADRQKQSFCGKLL